MALSVRTFIVTLAATITAIGAQSCSPEIQLETGEIPGTEIRGRLGETLELRCVVPGGLITLETYMWTFDGRPVSTDERLIFNPLTIANGGEYRCTGTSSSCDDVQTSVAITVSTLPVITEPTDMLQVRLTVGDSFTLRCQASGAPAPTVKWLLSGDELADGSAEASYTMNTASQGDSGMYTCEASNTRGRVNVTVSVQVINTVCPVGQLPCLTNRSECIDHQSFCNDVNDCQDGSDETDCRITTDMLRIQPVEPRAENSTADPLGYYIAIGVTAGVSLGIGMLSLLCCLILVCPNCCRQTNPYEEDYSDWPDGGESAEVEETRMEQSNQEGEERSGKGEEGVVNPAEERGEETRTAPSEAVTPSEVSPSEVGEIM